MTNFMRYEFAAMTDPAALTMAAYKDFYAGSMSASQVADRFLHAAAALPEGGTLGWQIDAAAMDRTGGFVFSGSGVKLTDEDLNWIFREVAAVSPQTDDVLRDLWTDGRHVYLLHPAADGLESCDPLMDPITRARVEAADRSHIREHFDELSGMLKEANVVIRLVLGPSSGSLSGCGLVCFSLPHEMTLRLRSTLSMTFPYTTLTEVPGSNDFAAERECLPGSCMKAVVEELLLFLMRSGGENEESPELLMTEETGMYLEELELSVRTYNCLKRAGIRYVDELLEMTDEDLRQVRSLGPKSIEEIHEKLKEFGFSASGSRPDDLSPETKSPSEMLEELIGLEPVKEQVRKITAFARMKKDMEASGHGSFPAVLNMEFIGNPGTAKTTVARILAGIFHEIGLLDSGEVLEVGRGDLVAKYVGHTADRVREVFRKAKGRLLFLDEAYSLVDDRAGSFGDEAINTIVQEMENRRDETIVIFAGYPGKMDGFIDRNPGLRSRVPFRIQFGDYSADELLQIAELEAGCRGFSLDAAAKDRVLELCGAAAGRADAGNGRFCRNLVENAILEYAARVYGDEGASEQKDCVLREGDFSLSELSAAESEQRKEARVIGFRV